MRFLPKNDPFWGKNVCYFLEFSRRYTAFPESEKVYKCQIRIPRTHFYVVFRQKSHFFQLFASAHRLSLNQGSAFSLRKCQIRIPPHVFTPRGDISRKIFYVVLTNHDFPTIRSRRDASKNCIRIHFSELVSITIRPRRDA